MNAVQTGATEIDPKIDDGKPYAAKKAELTKKRNFTTPPVPIMPINGE